MTDFINTVQGASDFVDSGDLESEIITGGVGFGEGGFGEGGFGGTKILILHNSTTFWVNLE